MWRSKPKEIKLTSKRIPLSTHTHTHTHTHTRPHAHSYKWSHSYMDTMLKHPSIILPHNHFLPFSALFSALMVVDLYGVHQSYFLVLWCSVGLTKVKVEGKLKLEYLYPLPSLPYRGSGHGWVAGLQPHWKRMCLFPSSKLPPVSLNASPSSLHLPSYVAMVSCRVLLSQLTPLRMCPSFNFLQLNFWVCSISSPRT